MPGEGFERGRGQVSAPEDRVPRVPRAVAVGIYIVVSVGTLALLVLHTLKVRGVAVDTTSLGLLALLVIIPLAPYIRRISAGPVSAEIGTREARELRRTAADLPLVTRRTQLSAPTPTSEPTIDELIARDPPLGLAKLRIELEQELRRLYYRGDTTPALGRQPSLSQMTRTLRERQVLPPEIAGPLEDVIGLANRAVHGAYVAPDAAGEIADVGLRVLALLGSMPPSAADKQDI
jgi:hypothetical protein